MARRASIATANTQRHVRAHARRRRAPGAPSAEGL